MAGGGGGGEGDGDYGFQIAPMVDVVFVLLLFFMACAGQQITEGFLPINLPSGQKESTGDTKTPIVVDIDGQGNIYMNSSPVASNPKEREIPALLSRLQESMKASPEDPVIIRPTPDAKHERLIDVLNTCKLAKVKNLSFG